MSAGLLLAGATVGSTLANVFSQKSMNKKTRRFQEKMWQKTNEYNHPAAQMKRLTDAGLNPHLVYGQGSGGAAGNTDMPAAPDMKAPDFAPIGGAVSGTIDQIYNLKAVKANTEESEARTGNIKQDTTNKALESIGRVLSNQKGKMSNEQYKRLMDLEVKTAEARLRNINVDSTVKSSADFRAERMANATIPKINEELKYMIQKGKGLNYDNLIKAIDYKLYKEYRVRPNDPVYSRVISRILEALDGDSSQLFKRGPLKGYFD